MESIGRRRFLATTAGGGLAGILAARVPPARGQQREISYLCWNNFAPAMDKKQNDIAQRFTRDTGIKLRIDYIAHPQQPAKYAAEVQTQAGHDLVEMRMHFPWLYEPQLTDVSDLVAELEKKHGKTVRINSPATEQMVEWYKKMYRDCMEPEVLSWTDASNNESLQQGKAGWIHNPVSAYIVAKQRKLPTADLINHHRSLGGPGGRHETDVPRSIGIWKFSKHVEPAKEWVRYLLGKREVYDEWIMSADAFNLPIYERLQDHPVLRTDPKYAALGAPGVQYHLYGWPAPPTDKIQLITNSFIVPNMLAKAVTGTPNKEA